jgi:hypothetical protein
MPQSDESKPPAAHLAPRETPAEAVEPGDARRGPRFTMEWALPLEPGLPTYVVVFDHAGEHHEWRAVGADETDALATLIGQMSEAGASRDALDFVAAAYRARLPER